MAIAYGEYTQQHNCLIKDTEEVVYEKIACLKEVTLVCGLRATNYTFN